MQSMEILGATGAGALVGGALTWITSMRKESHERQLALIDKLRDVAADADASADKAAARDWDACAEYVHMLLTKAKGE